MLISQSFNGVSKASIFFLMLCSIGERTTQLSDEPKSQTTFCCRTKSLDLSTANTLSNIAEELLSANLLNVHGEDYAETAFHRKLRAQQK